MLQEHREGAGVTREELGTRKALLRTNREKCLKLGLPLSLEEESAECARNVQRIERSSRPYPEGCYSELHKLIDLCPAGSTEDEISAAIEEDRSVARDVHQDELREIGRRLAVMVWNTADEPEFLHHSLSAELSKVGHYSWAEAAFVGRCIAERLGIALRRYQPDRPKLDLEP